MSEITAEYIMEKADELKAEIVRTSQEEEADTRAQILQERENALSRVDSLLASGDYNRMLVLMTKYGVIDLEEKVRNV